jgi:hypothetical protein
VEHGKVLPGILAELGIPVDVQHTDVEVGDREGPLQVPRLGKSLVGDHQLHPELPVGGGAYGGEKPPVQALDKLKGPQNHRMAPPVPQDGLGKFLELRKNADFLADNPIIQKGEQLMVSD